MRKLKTSHHFDHPRASGATALASEIAKPATIAATMIRDGGGAFLLNCDGGISRLAGIFPGILPPDDGGGLLLMRVSSASARCDQKRQPLDSDAAKTSSSLCRTDCRVARPSRSGRPGRARDKKPRHAGIILHLTLRRRVRAGTGLIVDVQHGWRRFLSLRDPAGALHTAGPPARLLTAV